MLQNEYTHNRRFREYVDKYCLHHGISVAEALEHEVVRQVYLYYTDV